MYIFFDTETNGKILDWKETPKQVDKFPRITQLGYQVYDKDQKLIKEVNKLILPDGWEIPKEPFFIENGHSTERNLEFGVPIDGVMQEFIKDLLKCEIMIAHNIAFDHPVVCAELIRLNLKSDKKLKKFCTMKSTTNILKLSGKYGYKWPTLIELNNYLFNTSFDGAHDAMADVTATANCFFELLKRDLITV